MPLQYYAEQLNLLLLLCPAVVMAAPLIAWHRFGRDEIPMFLGVSAASMLLLQVVWRSQIGVVDDWNLYAIGGMLASVFLWHLITTVASTRSRESGGFRRSAATRARIVGSADAKAIMRWYFAS